MKDILVIEDDKLMRQFVAEILGTAGYSVIEAGDAKTGVELGRTTFAPAFSWLTQGFSRGLLPLGRS